MGLVDRIKELADEKHITFAELEREINISNGQIRRWDKASPKSENLQKVAEYFGVSTDYLLGRTDNRAFNSTKERRELTIEQALKSVMSYDGKPMTDNDREILKGIIEAYMDKK